MCSLHLLLFFGMLTVKSVLSANILYVSNVPSPSHHIWNQALALGLASRGHNVTFIAPDVDKSQKRQNYTHILLEGIYKAKEKYVNFNDFATFSSLRMIWKFKAYVVYFCEETLKTTGFKRLLEYPPNSFDLIIFDVTTGSCLYPLIHRFNYPLAVGVTAFLLPSYVSFSMGNHLYPSYLPWYGFQCTSDMNLIERVWNFIFTYFDVSLKYLSLYPNEQTLAKRVFGQDIPETKELQRHFSIILANTDPILDHPQPLPPNIILVGGLHTRKSKELPKDLQKLVDDAKDGVIVFSLGSNIRSDQLGQDTINQIIEALGKLKETTIWKFESERKNLPKNVIIRKWLPQNDILGHPNVKLFIGHGGALSTQETIFHGVPMVAVPFFIDQYLNTELILKKKVGVAVDCKHITSDYFLSKIREVLDNPMYTTNMKKLSSMFKDRTETPLERGIFWIEYVLRHGGADFLSIAGRDLPFYKLLGLDVVTVLLLVLYVTIVLLRKVLRLFLSLFVNKRKEKLH